MQGAAAERRMRVIPVQISSDTATYEWRVGEEVKRPTGEKTKSSRDEETVRGQSSVDSSQRESLWRPRAKLRKRL